MGRVYLTYTPGGRPVALKVIRAEFVDDPGFRRRFEQEVITAQRVHGLYTAPVIDANTRAEQPWLATAYVAGPSLQQAVGVYGPLPEESALVLIAGIAEALQSIHAAGVVHRDLKASNVILAADGPHVIDFGIARAVDTTSVTQTGVRVGTPAFMAPEQVRGQSATPAVDVFALGALGCYAATGELPFGGGLDPLVPHRILEEEPDLAACPRPLRDLVTQCLAKDPLMRPSPTQVIELCREASTGTRLQMGESWLPPLVAAAVHRIATTPPPPVPAAQRRRNRRLVALAVVSVVAVAAVVAAVLIGPFGTVPGSANPGATTRREPPPDTSSSSSSSSPPTTSGPSGTTTSTTTGAPLPPFTPSDEEIRGGGEATLTPDLAFLDTYDWETYSDGSAYRGLQFTQRGLAGHDGVQFGPLADGADTSFATCRDHPNWVPAITWAEVHRGSFLCMRTPDGRRGILRIDAMPNFDDLEPFTVLTGTTWERKV
jgi:serine/threonine protein kinase